MIKVQKENDGQFYFEIKAKGGNVLLHSVKFRNKNDLNVEVKDLISSGKNDSVFERKTNHGGKFLFSVKNKKGQLIGNSTSYVSEAGMENGIKNLKNRIMLSTQEEKS
jgi:uncharacterized protein YegP (UPF0339 family)